MRNGTFPGAAKMPHVVRSAPLDIRGRLWSLYWLVRFCHRPKVIGSRYDEPVKAGGVVVELGVRNGDSTRAILCALEDLADGSILWSYDVEDVGVHVRTYTTEALGMPWPTASWCFTQLSGAAAGAAWCGGYVDLVFVDTDHLFETTKAEIAAWVPHVRVGGCLVFHDYWLHDPNRPEEGHGVKFAVDVFWEMNKSAWQLETHDACEDTGLAILWRNR